MRSAEELRYLILAAQREGNRRLMAGLSAIDLTPAQSEALRIVADHGPLALKDLGDMLVCDSGASPSRIVDRLVTAGLVRRETGEHDRRQVRLSATPQGEATAAEVREIEDRLYAVLDAALAGEDPQVLVRVLRALTHGSPAGTALERRIAADASSR